MRKLLIVALLLNAGFLFAIWQQLSVVAEVGSGAGFSDCERYPTQYSLDSNADGAVDLSDGIYFLTWLFSGTEAPRICLADNDPVEARLVVLEASMVESEARTAAIEDAIIEGACALEAATSDGADIPENCQRPGRGDGTILTVDEGMGVTVDLIKLLYSRSLPCARQEGNEVIFEGCNVNIRSGLGPLDPSCACHPPGPDGGAGTEVNGLGNLIVGYNESDGFQGGPENRTGSHNLVVGPYHTYSSYGGVVFGINNAVHAEHSSITGGYENVITTGSPRLSRAFASISGGARGRTESAGASISGGFENHALGLHSSVSGGYANEALGPYSSISGGWDNEGLGSYSSISGGWGNEARGTYGSISGGGSNVATGTGASVSGGRCGHAFGEYSAVSGGRNAGANGRYSTNAGFSGFVVNQNDESIAGWAKVYFADVEVTQFPDAAVPNGHTTFPGGPPTCPAPQ